MAQWSDLVSAALLGTEHNTLSSLKGEGALADLLEQIQAGQDRSPERVLLNAAATVAIHRRSGQKPVHRSSEPMSVSLAGEPAGVTGQFGGRLAVPAEPDELPVLNTLSSVHLEQLLDEYKQSILPQWLKALAQSKKRLPEMFLPAFLDYARWHFHLKAENDDLLPVLGKRGLWLAAQNPDWKSFVSEPVAGKREGALKERFETGSPAERASAIRTLRAIDPLAACQLVQSTWAEDTFQQRVFFLQVLSLGLSMDDEPFLEEKGLADKRKEVRLQAVNLLARLPQSRLQKRMLERTLPLIRLKGLLNKSLDVSFPDTCDQTMVRDGMEAKPSADGKGDKQAWLQQMLSLVPPSAWEIHLKAPPQALLSAINEAEPYAQAVTRGWEAATILHQDKSWAQAIITANLKTNLATNYGELMKILPAAEQERLMLQLIDANRGHFCLDSPSYNQPLLEVLKSLIHEWSDAFARKIIDVLVAELRSTGDRQYFLWAVRSTIPQIAFHIPLTSLSVADAVFSEQRSQWEGLQEAIDKFLTVSQFRQTIFSALDQ